MIIPSNIQSVNQLFTFGLNDMYVEPEWTEYQTQSFSTYTAVTAVRRGPGGLNLHRVSFTLNSPGNISNSKATLGISISSNRNYSLVPLDLNIGFNNSSELTYIFGANNFTKALTISAGHHFYPLLALGTFSTSFYKLTSVDYIEVSLNKFALNFEFEPQRTMTINLFGLYEYTDFNPINRGDNDIILWLRSDHGLSTNASNYLSGWLDYSNVGNNCSSLGWGKARIEGYVNEIPYIWGDLTGGAGNTIARIDNPIRASNTDNVLSLITVFKTNSAMGINNFIECLGLTFYNPSSIVTGSGRGMGFEDQDMLGRPCFAFSPIGPGSYIAPLSVFKPHTVYTAVVQIFENTGSVKVHLNGSLYSNNIIVSADPFYWAAKNITGLAEAGVWAPYNKRYGGILEMLAFRRTLTEREIYDFQNYINLKYDLSETVSPLLNISNTKKFYIGNSEVQRMYLEKNLIYNNRDYQTLFTFGSGNNGIYQFPEYFNATYQGVQDSNSLSVLPPVVTYFGYIGYWELRNKFYNPYVNFSQNFGLEIERVPGYSSDDLDFIPIIELGNSNGAREIWEFSTAGIGYEKIVVPLIPNSEILDDFAEYVAIGKIFGSWNSGLKFNKFVKFVN